MALKVSMKYIYDDTKLKGSKKKQLGCPEQLEV